MCVNVFRFLKVTFLETARGVRGAAAGTLADELVSEHAPAPVPEHVHDQVRLQRPAHGVLLGGEGGRSRGLVQVGHKRTAGDMGEKEGGDGGMRELHYTPTFHPRMLLNRKQVYSQEKASQKCNVGKGIHIGLLCKGKLLCFIMFYQ